MQNSPLLLTIDQGSQSSRAMVYDGRGTLVSGGKRAVKTSCPQPGWVEHDPEEIIDSVQQAIAMTVQNLGQQASDLVAAGIASQRSSLVCWDSASGRALSPVISWQDRRASDILSPLSSRFTEIQRRTGLFPSAHYGASKIRWCLNRLAPVQSALKQETLAIGPLASFLAFRLLRERPLLVDPANASRTMLFNLRKLDWDTDLLNIFGIPQRILPLCVPTASLYGHLELNGRDIPLQIMNGDLSAALFATGQPRSDTACIQLGTGAFIQMYTGNALQFSDRLPSGIVLSRRGRHSYVLEATVNGAGSALQWLEQRLSMENLLQNMPSWLHRKGDIPLFLNGIAGLGSPFWLSGFRSRFVGQGRPWQLAVAVIESIIFLLQANLDCMKKLATAPERIRVGGGIARLDGLCQRLADLSALPVYRPARIEATARGTAWLLADIAEPWTEAEPERCFLPRDNPDLLQRYCRWQELMPQ